jgi:hypothetical protein
MSTDSSTFADILAAMETIVITTIANINAVNVSVDVFTETNLSIVLDRIVHHSNLGIRQIIANTIATVGINVDTSSVMMKISSDAIERITNVYAAAAVTANYNNLISKTRSNRSTNVASDISGNVNDVIAVDKFTTH